MENVRNISILILYFFLYLCFPEMYVFCGSKHGHLTRNKWEK